MNLLKDKASFIKFLILPLALGLLSGICRANAQGSGRYVQPLFFLDIPPGPYMPYSDKAELPFGFYLTYLTALSNMTRNTLSNSPDTHLPLFIDPGREWIPPIPEIYRSFLVQEMPLPPPYGSTAPSILPSSIGYGNMLYNNIIIHNIISRMLIPNQVVNYFGSITNGAHPFPEYESLMVHGMPFFPEFYPWSPSFKNFFLEPLFPEDSSSDYEANYSYGSELSPELLIVEVKGYVYDSETYLPLEGVKVSLKYSNSLFDFYTNYKGEFLFAFFPDKYTFLFSKEGYQDIEKEVYVIPLGGMETSILYMENIYMEREIQNKEPVLKVPSIIEAVAGETFMLDPLTIAYDPDGDFLNFSFSGWNADYWNNSFSYTLTEDDIGVHEVFVMVSDQQYSITGILVITVYPGYEILLYEGLNLISYPFEDGNPDFTAFDLLEELGGFPRIESIAYYDNYTDKYIRAYYESNGEPLGVDFPIQIGEGYVIYAKECMKRIVFNRYTGEEHYFDLYEGMNLIGIASCPEGYTSYHLLMDLEDNNVESISHYDPFWGDWEFTYWVNGKPAGGIFPILMGEGYYIWIHEGP